jgi:penicillin amidase
MINRYLSQMNGITVEDMQKMQGDNYNALAETALPFLLSRIRQDQLTKEEKKYLELIRSWNKRNDNDEQGPTIFTTWYQQLEKNIWDDELSRQPAPFKRPEPETLIELLMKDSAFSFVDNILTKEKETIEDEVTNSFKKSVPVFIIAEKEGRLVWSKFKDSGIRHLLRLEPLSRLHLNTGGGESIINAIKQFTGPSWRMIVHLTDVTEAYGIYPGGQSGNPGSMYYDIFVDDWLSGKYYSLWKMKKEEAGDTRVQYVIKFSNG